MVKKECIKNVDRKHLAEKIMFQVRYMCKTLVCSGSATLRIKLLRIKIISNIAYLTIRIAYSVLK